jgi:hypothetical protein
MSCRWGEGSLSSPAKRGRGTTRSVVEGAFAGPQAGIESTSVPARLKKYLLRINGITDGEKNVRSGFVHIPRSSRIILGIALAGTGSGPGIGRAAVTSRRGFGSHDLRGRPTGRHSQAKRQCFVEGRRIIRASLSMECTWSGARDRSTVATDTGRAGMGVPVLFYEFVRRFPARPSSRLLSGQTRERAWQRRGAQADTHYG